MFLNLYGSFQSGVDLSEHDFVDTALTRKITALVIPSHADNLQKAEMRSFSGIGDHTSYESSISNARE